MLSSAESDCEVLKASGMRVCEPVSAGIIYSAVCQHCEASSSIFSKGSVSLLRELDKNCVGGSVFSLL